jgi:hypothetical protein
VTIQQAIWNFFKFTGIDSWDIESATSTFVRLQNEYYDKDRKET